MYSTKFFPFRIPYLAMILVEPNLVDSDCLHNQHGNVHLGHRVSSGRDSWPSKEEAFNYFRKRALWNTWDIRVLSIYVVRLQDSVLKNSLFYTIVSRTQESI